MVFSEVKKVVKFGGTSLANAAQFVKCAEIIKSEKSRKYVVPSAPGKRFPEDTKITDMLIKCYELSAKKEDFSGLFNDIKDRYNSIIRELSLNINLDDEYKIIEEAIQKGATLDYVASRGEYLNGLILSAYIGFPFIDAKDVVFFNEKGQFDAQKTNDVMSERLKHCENAVIPGFYGSLPDGSIKTFSRGGSDITGAIVARAVMADIYENWTDVSGFLMCDPRIVKNPRPIKVITYRELRELSYMGAGVLHEDSIFPVKLAGIPINIRNTNKPSDPGTMIVPAAEDYDTHDIVTGIAGKKGFAVIRIEKDMMNQEKGFGARVLKVFADMDMSFEHLPSGIDTMCVVIAHSEIKGKEKEILDNITKAVNPDNIEIETNLGLIAVVGRGMIRTPGTAYRIFKAVASENINVRMIDQGSSELNIIIGVDEKDFDRAIELIYLEFCN
ncbi:MAG TPA: aspartate kinase [Bacillota bacterium]|nr:aspartate kinase [Bacillota bacterium]HOK69428.1 aspartate kinase [Bacillota bacterium]HPP86042.1 aspartate kinase [Bacillota bacterium]